MIMEETDAAVSNSLPFNNSSSSSLLPNLVSANSGDTKKYDLSSGTRLALIFNQQQFAPHLNLGDRPGSQHDVLAIQRTFGNLGFDCIEHKNMKRDEIETLIKELDYFEEEISCLAIFFLTHGDANRVLFARDHKFVLDAFVLPSIQECPRLRSRPKLIFVQACRGTKTDRGVRVRHSSADGPTQSGLTPKTADTVVFESAYDGYYSFRSEKEGSWFIQSLCKVLDDCENSLEFNCFLTEVKRVVATQYVSFSPNMPEHHEKVAMPDVVHNTLIAQLYLKAHLGLTNGNVEGNGSVVNDENERIVQEGIRTSKNGRVSMDAQNRFELLKACCLIM